ncbi:hypothetical protein VU06_03455, partial [Desulfobulbus sp. F3]|nr:hypothetical protein [Desulfobulbus sp. F3]
MSLKKLSHMERQSQAATSAASIRACPGANAANFDLVRTHSFRGDKQQAHLEVKRKNLISPLNVLFLVMAEPD